MPSLIDIRRRVRAIKSTQQITKAMKMVSSSKLRRAQERIQRSRPYAQEMLRVFNSLATRVDPSAHPLLNDDPSPGRTLLVVITADRGLCGSFNTNVIKTASHFVTEHSGDPGRDVALALVGRKGRDFFMRRGFDVLYEEVGLFQQVKWSHAQAIAKSCIEEFLSPDVSSRLPGLQRVPVGHPAAGGRRAAAADSRSSKPRVARGQSTAVDYLFEPSPEQLLERPAAVPRRGAGGRARCSSHRPPSTRRA